MTAEHVDLPLYARPLPWAEHPNNPTDLDRAFDVWLHGPLGGQVARAFIAISCSLHKRGWKRFSAKAIIERIRWNMEIKSGPDAGGFLINNNFTSRLPRHAMYKCPQLDGFFELRALKT